MIPRHFVSVETFALCVCASSEAFRSLTVIGDDYSIFFLCVITVVISGISFNCKTGSFSKFYSAFL